MILDTNLDGLLRGGLIKIESEVKRLGLQDSLSLRMAFAHFFNDVIKENQREDLMLLQTAAVGEELRFVKLALMLSKPDKDDPKLELQLWFRQFAGMTFMVEWNHHVKLNRIIRLLDKKDQPTITAPQAKSAAEVSFRTHVSLKNMSIEQLRALDIQDHCMKITRRIRNKYRPA